ncbi:MAG: hypothetical protein M1820_010624 [Bogoriella megaspora]|nr:MAG: hypothetical protein M1820_010624 [Bogoriella megaspora]
MTVDPLRPQHPGGFAGKPESQMEEVTITSPGAQDPARGRRRTRDQSLSEGEQGEPGAEGADTTGGSSRKRRRSRKGLDKKFECPHEGCGKSYSRAEHLYRHQLNHNPKQIYQCDFPGCNRTFVRQDLCTRHKERHTAKGSHLQRKDSLMHALNPLPGGSAIKSRADGLPTPHLNHQPGEGLFRSNTIEIGGLAPKGLAAHSPISGSTTTGSVPSPPVDTSVQSPQSDANGHSTGHNLHRSRSDDVYHVGNTLKTFDMNGAPQNRGTSSYKSDHRTTSFGSIDSVGPQFSPHTGGHQHNSSMQSPASAPPNKSHYTPSPFGRSNSISDQGQMQPPLPHSQYGQQPVDNYGVQPSYTPNTSAISYSTSSSTGPNDPNSAYGPPGAGSINPASQVAGFNGAANSVADEQMLDQLGAAQSVPVFGGEGFSRSPFAMADDFTAWLLQDQSLSNGNYAMGMLSNGASGLTSLGLQAPYFNYDPLISGQYTEPAPPPHPMALNSIIDTSLPETSLSEEKRQCIIDYITIRFNEIDSAPVKKQKEALTEGDQNDPAHVLSLRMMQTYIGSYWLHFHQQMPILHRPTFSANGCPDLLLIAMIAIGAACLEKTHGHAVTTACAELSNFLAWHLRWQLFQDLDFRPPAKLWVFQALLLLEVFEKMYSSRPLHERAHIHHATTLTLMRRGSSLIGRSALDSPPSIKEGITRNSASSGTGHTPLGTSAANTPDEWWNHWITNEATRRVAFAAFVIDSTHATMFGHSAVMVAHEMRLPLPCDEYLWGAKSSAEVARAESSLQANGIKQITFLDGLKKTLNGQTVVTNSFGRVIIMAGLLSVSWHMNQRDLQVSSLGVTQALGGRDRWKGSLTRAFDLWKRDFDESLAKVNHSEQNHATHSVSPLRLPGTFQNGLDDGNIFEARTVLHHLAHMAMHVDIVDCQIFAGAARLLGRSITPQDYAGVQRRMRESWAPTARARDATFYALRFLSQVLIPEDHPGEQPRQQRMNLDGDSPPLDPSSTLMYSARDDFLLNRPWVLYFAALIVWCYGYALDGPIVPTSATITGHQIHLSGRSVREAQRSESRTLSPTERPLEPVPDSRGFKLESPVQQYSSSWNVPATNQQQQSYARPSQPLSASAPGAISITPSHPIPRTAQQRVTDMKAFLRRVGGVRAPDDLAKLPDRNGCLGMLLLLRDMFRKTRWELLHEASNLLGNCCEMLCPNSSTIDGA